MATMKGKGSTPIVGDYHVVEYIQVSVTDPTTISDETGQYTRYKVSTETTFPQYKKESFSVLRRYKQFVQLRDHLKERLAANPKAQKFGDTPPLPGNTMGSLLNVGKSRYEPDFVEERRKGLEEFINTVAQHNFFRFESALHDFLQNEEFVIKNP
eukprot:TRINITY_DN2774_c0_g1_i2.p1 TRINITY_DN2774_c0_g1~~TRINITY_DN2774_c0_g1_i2.p1  ORF type:complete len:155 (+),score=25.61 TRINITY_DN2774_c0_g1_i2:73-537(+)